MSFRMPDRWRPPAIAVLVALVAGCGTTYGTGVSPGRQTVSDITGMVSIGSKSKAPIEYAPRPTIVAPPSTATLPKPGEVNSAANWPTDPDVVAKQKQIASSGRRKEETQSEILSDPGFRLPSSGSNSNISERSNDPDSAESQIFGMQKQKKEVGKVFAKAKASAVGAVDENGNPVRTMLTEPPSKYRVPDPSAPAEFEAAKNEKWYQVFRRNGSNTAVAVETPKPDVDGATADAAKVESAPGQ